MGNFLATSCRSVRVVHNLDPNLAPRCPHWHRSAHHDPVVPEDYLLDVIEEELALRLEVIALRVVHFRSLAVLLQARRHELGLPEQ